MSPPYTWRTCNIEVGGLFSAWTPEFGLYLTSLLTRGAAVFGFESEKAAGRGAFERQPPLEGLFVRPQVWIIIQEALEGFMLVSCCHKGNGVRVFPGGCSSIIPNVA